MINQIDLHMLKIFKNKKELHMTEQYKKMSLHGFIWSSPVIKMFLRHYLNKQMDSKMSVLKPIIKWMLFIYSELGILELIVLL